MALVTRHLPAPVAGSRLVAATDIREGMNERMAQVATAALRAGVPRTWLGLVQYFGPLNETNRLDVGGTFHPETGELGLRLPQTMADARRGVVDLVHELAHAASLVVTPQGRQFILSNDPRWTVSGEVLDQAPGEFIAELLAAARRDPVLKEHFTYPMALGSRPAGFKAQQNPDRPHFFAEEIFAQAVAAYITEPARLERMAPKTAAFIKGFIHDTSTETGLRSTRAQTGSGTTAGAPNSDRRGMGRSATSVPAEVRRGSANRGRDDSPGASNAHPGGSNPNGRASDSVPNNRTGRDDHRLSISSLLPRQLRQRTRQAVSAEELLQELRTGQPLTVDTARTSTDWVRERLLDATLPFLRMLGNDRGHVLYKAFSRFQNQANSLMRAVGERFESSITNEIARAARAMGVSPAELSTHVGQYALARYAPEGNYELLQRHQADAQDAQDDSDIAQV